MKRRRVGGFIAPSFQFFRTKDADIYCFYSISSYRKYMHSKKIVIIPKFLLNNLCGNEKISEISDVEGGAQFS